MFEGCSIQTRVAEFEQLSSLCLLTAASCRQRRLRSAPLPAAYSLCTTTTAPTSQHPAVRTKPTLHFPTLVPHRPYRPRIVLAISSLRTLLIL